MSERTLTQTAPYPDALAELIDRWSYMPGWSASLESREREPGCSGLDLIISVTGPDTDYAPDEDGHWPKITVWHGFVVPAATYNEVTWRRWFFDCILLVHQHEACEFFKIDGSRPYAPHHGPGRNPYVLYERGIDMEREANMDQRGVENARKA